MNSSWSVLKMWILCVLTCVPMLYAQSSSVAPDLSTSMHGTLKADVNNPFADAIDVNTDDPKPSDVTGMDMRNNVSDGVEGGNGNHTEDLLMQEVMAMEDAVRKDQMTSNPPPKRTTQSIIAFKEWLDSIDGKMRQQPDVSSDPILMTSSVQPNMIETITNPIPKGSSDPLAADIFFWLNTFSDHTKPATISPNADAKSIDGNTLPVSEQNPNNRQSEVFAEWMSSVKIGINTIDHPTSSVDLFRRWMNLVHTMPVAATKRPTPINTNQNSFSRMDGVASEHTESADNFLPTRVLAAKPHLSTQKLIIVVSVVSGTLVFFSVAITLCYFCRQSGEGDISEKTESSLECVVANVGDGKKAIPTVNVVSADDDLNIFMGIPTNNDIWRELQALPNTASSVFSESDKL